MREVEPRRPHTGRRCRDSEGGRRWTMSTPAPLWRVGTKSTRLTVYTMAKVLASLEVPGIPRSFGGQGVIDEYFGIMVFLNSLYLFRKLNCVRRTTDHETIEYTNTTQQTIHNREPATGGVTGLAEVMDDRVEATRWSQCLQRRKPQPVSSNIVVVDGSCDGMSSTAQVTRNLPNQTKHIFLRMIEIGGKKSLERYSSRKFEKSNIYLIK